MHRCGHEPARHPDAFVAGSGGLFSSKCPPGIFLVGPCWPRGDDGTVPRTAERRPGQGKVISMTRYFVSRVAVCLGLLGSGVLSILGARERWGPCTPYHFATQLCALRQDYRYEYIGPEPNWIPVGHAAQIGGSALIVLAIAAVLLPYVLAPQAPRRLTWSIAAMLCASVLTVGIVTCLSGHVGHPVAPTALTVGGWFWVLGWPIIFLVLAVAVIVDTGRMRWRLVSLPFLIASTPWGQLVLTPLVFMYWSYDSTPWGEAVGGLCLIVAAGPLWIGTRRGNIAVRPSTPAVGPASAPAEESVRRHGAHQR